MSRCKYSPRKQKSSAQKHHLGWMNHGGAKVGGLGWVSLGGMRYRTPQGGNRYPQMAPLPWAVKIRGQGRPLSPLSLLCLVLKNEQKMVPPSVPEPLTYANIHLSAFWSVGAVFMVKIQSSQICPFPGYLPLLVVNLTAKLDWLDREKTL